MQTNTKDFWSHSSVWLIALLLLVGIICISPFLSHLSTWLYVIMGAALFFIAEYYTHRYLFHGAASKKSFILRLQKRLHYDHHEYPNDLHLLFLPIWYSLPNFIVVWIVTFLITKLTLPANAIVVGAIAANLYYEWIHFVAHRSITPKTSWGRKIKKYHLLHHYKNENFWFGVTNPSLDLLHNTFQNEKDVETSATAKKLKQSIPRSPFM